MDNAFIHKVEQIILEHIEDEKFGTNELASEIGLSSSQLLRRIKNITGKTTTELIKELRLQEAAKLIKEGQFTASEISFQIGFSSPSYFNKCFHDHYGLTPGEYKEKFKNQIIEEETQPKHKKPTRLKHQKSILLIILSVVVIITSFILIKNSLNTRKKDQTYSIAVLPIKNLSDDNANQYFADGVMDDIMNHLSTIKEFKIISRTTMEQYRETKKTAPEIAKELKVSHIIESSIQKYKDSVRIITQLIDAKKDEHIWSKNFERQYKNIFALESKIAKSIALELKATLSPSEIKQIEKIPTKNIDAYNLYLKGKYFLHLGPGGIENIKNSIKYFKESINIDSTFALAFAGLAEAYLWYADSEKFDINTIEELALKAIELDSEISEPHFVLGNLACWYYWDWEMAEKKYKQAIKINPNNSRNYIYYSRFLFYTKGQVESSLELLNKSLDLDPLSIFSILTTADIYLSNKQYDKAFIESERAKEIERNTQWSNWIIFECYFRQGQNEKALAELIENWELNSISTKNIKPMKAAYDKDGIKGIYQWIIDYDLRNGDNSDGKLGVGWNNFQLYWIAQKYAFIGNKKEAINYLEIAFNRKSTMLYHIKYEPYFKDLRTEPRFLAILEKMNLGDYKHNNNLLP